MGLREMKAARTRAQILDVALELFQEKGYDSTTMEEVAEGAEVGISTLYRYFPSKELLVLAPLVSALELGRMLDERPDDEALGEALGAVLRDSFSEHGIDRRRILTLRRIVDSAPTPRARLWDLVTDAARDLEAAIRRRPDAPNGELDVAVTAQTVFFVYDLIGKRWGAGGAREPWERVADRTLAELDSLSVVLPR